MKREENIVVLSNILTTACKLHIMRPRCYPADRIRNLIRNLTQHMPAEDQKEFRFQEIYEAAVEAGIYMRQFEPDFYKDKAEWCRWYVETKRVSLKEAMFEWNMRDLDIRTTP